MQKIPVLVVAVVVVAVIVFLATRPAKKSWSSVEDGLASGDAPVGRLADAGSSSRSSAEAGSPRRPDDRRLGALGKEKARRFDVLKPRAGSGARGGAGSGADVVEGQERRTGGSVGRSTSSRPDTGAGGSSARIADVPQGAGRAREERRADMVDFLAQAPRDEAGGVDEYAEDEVVDGEEEDVVLSVPLNREHGTSAEDTTPPLVEQDLRFSEDGEGVEFGESSVLAFPDAGNLRGDAGTMTLEIEPKWAGAEGGDYSLINVRNANDPSNLLRVIKNGKYLRYIFADASGQEVGVSYDISEWQPGEKHTVAVNWGDAATALYVDNQLIGQNTYQGTFGIPPGTPLYLGSDIPEAGATGAGATISNFQVFGRPLTPGEIANLPTR